MTIDREDPPQLSALVMDTFGKDLVLDVANLTVEPHGDVSQHSSLKLEEARQQGRGVLHTQAPPRIALAGHRSR